MTYMFLLNCALKLVEEIILDMDGFFNKCVIFAVDGAVLPPIISLLSCKL